MGRVKKKGVFFTFIAITATIVFIFIFTPQAGVSLERNTEALKSRIGSVDGYVSDLENRYFENMLRDSAYKAISSLVMYVDVKKSFIPQAEFGEVFSEVILNGTIADPLGSTNHVTIDSITGQKIMENGTLLNWSEKIVAASKDAINVDTVIKIRTGSIKVFQETPWEFASEVNLSFDVKADDINAEWKNDSFIVKTNVSILGFNDPYYIVKTSWPYKNKIKKSSVKFNEWNLSKVIDHLISNEYVHWENTEAPSFLMKFSGLLGKSDCCGIESFVKPSVVSPSDQIEVYVDYLFWNPSSNPNCPTPPLTQPELYTINGLPPQFKGFKLDPKNVVRYNLETNSVGC